MQQTYSLILLTTCDDKTKSKRSMDKNPSLWRILFVVFGLRKLMVRLSLLRWLIFENFQAFFLKGCERPKNLLKRLEWYKKRFDGLVILYRLMSKYEDEMERNKGKKKEGNR